MIHQAWAWTWGQKAKCLLSDWTKGYKVLIHKGHVASVTGMKQQHMEYEAHFWHIPFMKLLVSWVKWCGTPGVIKALSECLQKIPGLLVDTELGVSQQCVLHTQVEKECPGLHWRNWEQLGGDYSPLPSTGVQFKASQCQRDMDRLQSPTKDPWGDSDSGVSLMGKGWESCDGLALRKEGSRGILSIPKSLKGEYKGSRARLLSVVSSERTRGQVCPPIHGSSSK